MPSKSDQQYKKALSLAASAPKRRAGGGGVVSGGLDGDTPGRADELNVSVPDGSHVIPADIVSHLGGGNTGAGLKSLGKMFPSPKRPKAGAVKLPTPKVQNIPVSAHLLAPKIAMPKAPAAKLHTLRMPKRADGGGVKCALSDGEFVVHPDQVRRIGEGNEERGHAALDAWILSNRQESIEKLKNLPGPVQS